MDALVIGGTRFIGRHLVDQLRDDYDVTTVTRGRSDDPFADASDVDHVQGDRTDPDAVTALAADVDPDVVFDMVAYHPPEVRHACEVFSDVDAYVYVSTGSVYDDPTVPLREDEATLHECTTEQEADDSMETYGPRKAECDRAVFAAADDGVRAMAVRPGLVYGPYDYTERFNYWIRRVDEGGPFLVPGDGGCLLHRAYVEDVASALRVVAENGDAGEAYNVGDRRAIPFAETFGRLADLLGTDATPVYASERELAAEDLAVTDFPLYTPRPFLQATEKLAALGWESTPLDDALERTVEDYRASERTGASLGPDGDAEASLVDRLT